MLVSAVAGSAWALDEHDAAKAAVATRESLPLAAIVARVSAQDSKVLDVRIEEDADGYRYHLKILESGNRVRKIVVDGRTGAVVAGD